MRGCCGSMSETGDCVTAATFDVTLSECISAMRLMLTDDCGTQPTLIEQLCMLECVWVIVTFDPVGPLVERGVPCYGQQFVTLQSVASATVCSSVVTDGQ